MLQGQVYQMRSWVLALWTLCFLVGVALASIESVTPLFSWWMFALACGIFLWSWHRSAWWCVLVAIGCCVAGWVWTDSFSRSVVERRERVMVTEMPSSWLGVVQELPDVRRENQRLVVCVIESSVDPSVERSLHSCRTRVLLTAPRFLRVRYGDLLRIQSKLEVPEPIEDFRYDQFLAVSGTTHVARTSRIDVVGTAPPSRLFASVLRARLWVERRVQRLFPEPEGAFLAGLLLGVRSGLAPQLMDQFSATGMTHIVALSGSNITLVGNVVFGLLAGLVPRRKAFWVTLGGIFVFVLVTGAASSLVRAGIMGSLALFAREVGRPATARSALLLLLVSAVCMTLWRPLALVWDAGFQLSFAATFGVLFVAPKLERWFLWLPEAFSLRESLLLSVATQFTTLPVSLYHFGSLSLVAPLANLLVLPVLPWVMLFGALAVGVSVVSDGLAMPFQAVTVGLLKWAIWVIEVLSGVAESV